MCLRLHHINYVLCPRASSVFMVESHTRDNHQTVNQFPCLQLRFIMLSIVLFRPEEMKLHVASSLQLQQLSVPLVNGPIILCALCVFTQSVTIL